MNGCIRDSMTADLFLDAGGGKDFVFGYKAVWVLAPQRDGAHNWEGTGLQTAVHSILALDLLANGRAARDGGGGVLKGRGADTSRVLFAGHSRGGHGAWMMGMHYPDMAVGVASLSGYGPLSQLCIEGLGLGVDEAAGVASVSGYGPLSQFCIEGLGLGVDKAAGVASVSGYGPLSSSRTCLAVG